MATEILKSFGTLQYELEQARSSLKGVDENIKRLIGRDPSEIIPRPNIVKRPLQNEDNRNRLRGPPGNRRPYNHENDEPLNKRRNSSAFKRLSERQNMYEEEMEQKPIKQMISKVIVTPKEVPSRQEALAAQNCDEKSKARNRRMFGALLGTLQKFQQEETKLKSREDKRAQLEKKIEEHEIREKAEIKKERRELFFNRKKKQAEIKMIELKMLRMKEYTVWEERQKPRMNFIQTKAKPHIHYLPRKLNDKNKTDLEEYKTEIESKYCSSTIKSQQSSFILVLELIDKKRQEVFDDLQHIEDCMKKNFERKPKTEEDNEEIKIENVNDSCDETNITEMDNVTNNVISEEDAKRSTPPLPNSCPEIAGESQNLENLYSEDVDEKKKVVADDIIMDSVTQKDVDPIKTDIQVSE
ncbi:pinn [Holotrichia oblita]|uniref:Pinn n=1 Tax=Holotrichia oblita TaxID=644536 RepID=A0ACB9TRG0_HOLOL|nr:pinn [Holotrichia oblita]